MYIDYRGSFECVEAVAQSMLGHAGDVEVFEDEDGWLCIRTPLMRRWSSPLGRDVVVEVNEETPVEDRQRWPDNERPAHEPEAGAFIVP
jgi:hypothetical protein